MSEQNNLLEMIHTELKENELVWQALLGVQEELHLKKVAKYSKAVSRDRHNRILRDIKVFRVTKHGRSKTASVTLGLHTFTELLIKVAEAAQQERRPQQDRVPFTDFLSDLTPVLEPVRPLQLDTNQEHHQLLSLAAR